MRLLQKSSSDLEKLYPVVRVVRSVRSADLASKAEAGYSQEPHLPDLCCSCSSVAL